MAIRYAAEQATRMSVACQSHEQEDLSFGILHAGVRRPFELGSRAPFYSAALKLETLSELSLTKYCGDSRRKLLEW